MRVLVTGTAGFIGLHLAERLLDDGHEVVGIDAFTPYYDLSLKEARHARLTARNGYSGHRIALENKAALDDVVAAAPIDLVVHLAGQAGVRYSLDNPRAYIDANIIGTFNLMESIRAHPVRHFMLASTSSAYGANEKMPFVETDRAVHPMSLYAATKVATEAMTHSYSHLFSIPTTAFRFFTVYGPWGRPDMAAFKFTRGIIEGTPIDVYNNGQMSRDFTYVGDLVEAIVRLSQVIPAHPTSRGKPIEGDSLSPIAPHRVVNIGGGAPVALMDFIRAIEQATGQHAKLNHLPMQAGDVPTTFADASLLQALTNYRPTTSVTDGMAAFVAWYRAFYRL